MLVQNIKDYGEELLNNKKLLSVKKQSQNGHDYLVVKYGRKVFYDNLWEKYPLLKQARGHVFDAETGDIVVRPFDKVFNLGENGAGFPDDELVAVFKKINGFMLAVTPTDKGFLYSTTGSIESDFVELGKKYVGDLVNHLGHLGNYTYLFEICAKEDPHIIQEEPGAYLLGWRFVDSGALVGSAVDSRVVPTEFRSPCAGTFKEVLPQMMKSEHEGFMVLSVEREAPMVKVKTPYYLSLKFLARMTDKKVDLVWGEPEKAMRKMDEDFQNLIPRLVSCWTKEQWLNMAEQERLDQLRGMVYGS